MRAETAGAFLLILWFTAAAALADLVPVSTPTQLIAAIDAAQPGDEITLAPGTYDLAQNLLCDSAGSANAPIKSPSTGYTAVGRPSTSACQPGLKTAE